MLDIGAVSLQFVENIVNRGTANFKTKGGLGLPLELWDMIFKFGAATCSSHKFQLAKATDIEDTPTGTTVRFESIQLAGNSKFSETPVDSYAALVRVYRFLADTRQSTRYGSTHQVLLETQQGGRLRVSSINIANAPDNPTQRFHFFYCHINIPDVIARHEGGLCVGVATAADSLPRAGTFHTE